jgi:hypothetical protein
MTRDMTTHTRLVPAMAVAILTLAAPSLAQEPTPAPPLSTPEAASAPAAGDAPTLAEQLSALRQEQATLAAEVESVRSRLGPADPGAPDEQRISELESRLEAVEAEISRLRREVALSTPPAATGPRGPADPAGMGTYNVLGDSGQITSGTAFNPQISVIPDGVYYNDNRGGAAGEITSEPDGFHAHGGGEGHSHGGGVERGFSLREAEITFSGAVDPYFDVWAIFAVANETIEVEEGYVLTRKFIPGMQLKFGKFYSGIGYINKQHPHQWDFVDQALPYDAIFGGALNETGVQLTWLPNLPFYTQLGVEALQGANERLASQIGESDETPWFSSKAGPRLLTGFLKVSPNVGYSNALQVGASYGYSSQHQELHDEVEDGVVDEAFQGHTQFIGADAVWKYDSPRQYGKGDLTVQAEYLYRIKNLDLVAEGGEPVAGGSVRFRQDGLYVQAVYGLFSRWTAGLRFDTIGLTNRIEGDEESASLDASRRYTADLTFNPTEFSRLRAQFAHGEFQVGGVKETFDQFYLQFQMSLGAHGAHKF